MSPAGRPRTAVYWLGVVSSVGMFLVLVMGATVTTTGSAQGCGRNWPLCGGKFIPDFAISTAIEFSHRAITGVEGILITALTVSVLVLYWKHGPARVLATLMFAFLVLQAGMGAWAVMVPQQPVVLALHFGISLIALASTVLTTVYIRDPQALTAAPAVPGSVRLMTWATAAYLYLLVYSGAYIAHVGAAPACPSWPLCGTATGAGLGPEAVAVDVLHRLAAGAALVLAAGLLLVYHRTASARADLVAGGWALIAALVLQGGAGAFLVLDRWGVGAVLLHDALTGLVFTAAASLCLRVTLGARAQVEPSPASPPRLRTEGVP